MVLSNPRSCATLVTNREMKKIPNIFTVPCDECEQSFTSTSSLERHIKLVHDNLREFKCSDCEYGASVKEDLMVHMKVQSSSVN